MDKYQEIRNVLPTFRAQVLFDVGANVGLTVREFRDAYPASAIYAFEPVDSTYQALCGRVGGDEQVKCFQLALGETKATAMMQAGLQSVASKIVQNARRRTEQPGTGQTIEVWTGDEFCAAQGVEHISYLKIDTEGYDLKVCRGFAGMLEARRIDLLQVEAGLHPEDRLHVPLQAFKDYLEARGYCIFRIFDQAGIPRAWRCNPVFISPRLAEQNLNPKRVARARSWL